MTDGTLEDEESGINRSAEELFGGIEGDRPGEPTRDDDRADSPDDDRIEDRTANDVFAQFREEADVADAGEILAGESPEDLIAAADEEGEPPRDDLVEDAEALDELLLTDRVAGEEFLWIDTDGEGADPAAEAGDDPETDEDPETDDDPETDEDPETDDDPEAGDHPEVDGDPEAGDHSETDEDLEADDDVPLSTAIERTLEGSDGAATVDPPGDEPDEATPEAEPSSAETARPEPNGEPSPADAGGGSPGRDDERPGADDDELSGGEPSSRTPAEEGGSTGGVVPEAASEGRPRVEEDSEGRQRTDEDSKGRPRVEGDSEGAASEGKTDLVVYDDGEETTGLFARLRSLLGSLFRR